MRRYSRAALLAAVLAGPMLAACGGDAPLVKAASSVSVSVGLDGASPDDRRLSGSYRFERNSWIFVHLQGNPSDLGYQHGYLLAPEIAELLRVMGPLIDHLSGKNWAFYRKAAQDVLWPKIDPEYQQEIDGIVEGVRAHGGKADRWDLVALNGYIELSQYYVPWLDQQSMRTPTVHSPESCSAFIATGAYTKDHRIVMGHNAWTDYVVGSRWNIVFDMAPAKGQRILMDGLPGIIVSDDDFDVNSAGLMITETTITKFVGFDPKGVPEFARARKALQYGASIDDFARIMLDGNNGGYANDWLVGDNKTGEVARFELGLKEHGLERTSDGYFVGSNFPVGAALIKHETTFDATNKTSSPNARHARWDQLMAQYKGRIDADVAKQLESDNYDIIAGAAGPSERSLCGTVETSPRGIKDWDWPPYFPGGTVQAKVMTAAMAEKLQFWAAYGHPCGQDFIAADFLAKHREFNWAKDLLRDMKTGPWTEFTSGAR